MVWDVGPTLTPKEKRDRALKEDGVPSQALVPRTRVDITYSDWLCGFANDYENDLGMFCGVSSFMALMVGAVVAAITASTGTLSPAVGYPIVGGCVAWISLCFYVCSLYIGNATEANFLSTIIYELRVGRIKRRDMRRAIRQARALDARGWRPRAFIPHPKGRDDTYDRYLVESHIIKGELALGLRRWHYRDLEHLDEHVFLEEREHPFWQPLDLSHVRWFEDASLSDEGPAAYRGQLEEEARGLQTEAEAQLAASRGAHLALTAREADMAPLATSFNTQALPQI